MHHAKDPDSISLLVNWGADVNAVDKYGHIPLYYQTDPEAAVQLILAGSNDYRFKDPNMFNNPMVQKAIRDVAPFKHYFLYFKNGQTASNIFNQTTVKNTILKKIFEDYLNRNTLALEEILLESGYPAHFSNYFKPEFIKNLQNEKKNRIAKQELAK